MDFPFLATCIGSFPHKDPNEALELILETLPDIPVWPQLPKRSILENMYFQYSEGMPGIRIDETREKIYFDTSGGLPGELERFYDRFLAEDLSYFAIHEAFSAGFYHAKEVLKTGDNGFIKGHVTGPVSFGLQVTDSAGRPIIYNEEVFDAVVKTLGTKAKWQARELSCGKQLIIFFDEPYLSAYGSSYVQVSRECVVRALNEVMELARKESCLCGVHCCGNTDWSLLLDTDCDILSFDAYSFFKNLLLYSDGVRRFLDRGGILSFGVVPTGSEFGTQDLEGLVDILEDCILSLEGKGMEKGKVKRRSIVTPACGVGTMSPGDARRALRLTREISDRFRRMP